jgi:hypothetical protein
MTDEDDKQERQGFKVQDRRRFSETGEVRPEYRDGVAETPRATEPAPSAPPSDSIASTYAESSPRPSLELSFSMFIISLSTQALAHLGEIPNPLDNSAMADLGAAKELIDILGILKEKTKGNLDHSEAALMDNILYELRLKYVERVRGQS